MNKTSNTLFGIIAIVILSSNLQSANSTLWDLLIEVGFEKNPLTEDDIPVVFGNVTDHAGKPVSEAEVKIRLGEKSIITTTDSLGSFVVEFSGFDEVPGSYIVNVYASNGDRVGIESVDFQVKGQISVFSQTERILSSPEAVKYLQASEADFEKDPLGLTLYYYYQDLQAQFFEEQKYQLELIEEQQYITEQRELSIQLTEQIIEEENPGAGTYSGYEYDRFVSNLDLSVRDIFVNQLNYTIGIFTAAQKAMNEVLATGGTMEEARQVYYEKAVISRETMEALTLINQTSIINENYTNFDLELVSELNLNGTEYNTEKIDSGYVLNINGTLIDVGKSGSVIYLNINGTIIELFVNGTEMSQATNSSQN
jgi:hypothetical protein